MIPLLLSLGASVAWGGSDFIAGVESRRTPPLVVAFLSQVAGLVAIAVVVAATGTPPPDGDHLALGVLAGACGAIALVALYRGLAEGAMGVVAPIVATDSIVPVTVGLLIGSVPSPLQGGGILLVMAGVVMACMEPGTLGRGKNLLAGGVPMAFLAALHFGAFVMLLSLAGAGGALWAVFVARIVSVAMLAQALLPMREPIRLERPERVRIGAAGLLDILATGLLAYALTLGSLSLVAVLSSLYPLVTAGLARLLIGERIGALQRAGTIGAIAGVALIAGG